MSDFALWPVLAGALAFFVVGAIWYTALFGKAWQKAAGFTDEELANEIVRSARRKEFAVAEFIHALVQSNAFKTK